MEEDLRVRFKEVLSFYKSNINQLSKGDKAMQVRLSRQINNGATITFETVSNILDTFPDVSAEWLLRGKGEMLIASSPNEFALVRLTTKKGRRELETGSVNLYAGTSIGVDEKNHIQIDIEKIDDYTFKVKPRYFLNTGEYCFYYQGSIPQGGYNNQSVFDFSIPQSCALEFYNKYSIDDTVWILRNGKPKNYEIRKFYVNEEGIFYGLGSRYDYEVELYASEKICYPSKKELKKALNIE